MERIFHQASMSATLAAKPTTVETIACAGMFGHACGHSRRSQVGLACRDWVASTFEQVRTHRLKAVRVRHPVVLVKRAKQGKPCLRAVHHRQGDSPAECNHRSRCHLVEHLIQRENLRPVRLLSGRSLVMHRGDCRLELIRTDWDSAQGSSDQCHAFGDLVASQRSRCCSARGTIDPVASVLAA